MGVSKSSETSHKVYSHKKEIFTPTKIRRVAFLVFCWKIPKVVIGFRNFGYDF
jgi:hypothetical protein